METFSQYVQALARFVDDPYGQQIRRQFADSRGRSELAMLAAPTREEYQQFCRLAAAMTDAQNRAADRLTDSDVQRLAEDAGVDKAVAAIVINGYALHKRKTAQQDKKQ